MNDHSAKIEKCRTDAHAAQASQAEKMVKRRRLDLIAGVACDNVAVPNPMMDRGRGDPRNILGVIISRDDDKDQYKIEVKAGIMKSLFSRNQFDLCPHHLLTETDVNQDNCDLVREPVRTVPSVQL